MSTKIETLENSKVKLTIEVTAERFEEGLKAAYEKNKKHIQLQGFRKGKAPRHMVERIYGKGVFYEDAANHVMPEAYEAAIKEHDVDVVSRPEIDIEQIEAGKTFIFTATVAVKPEVTLGDYKGLEVAKVELDITDEEVDAELASKAKQNGRKVEVTDRAVAQDDEVTIDFEGFVNGEAFEGGKGEDYPLVIGSHSFIDTFEDQLVGKNIGDAVEVNVTFPEEYHVEELKGQPALFKVNVKGIQVNELPELDDEFAKDTSDFETLAELKEDIKKNLVERKANSAKQAKQDEALEKAIANATMEVPAEMVDGEVDNMANNFANTMRYQGISLEQYLSMTGSNMASFRDSLKEEAAKRVNGRLVLEAIAKAENIEVSEEELNEELKKMAEMYNMELAELTKIMGEYEKEGTIADLKSRKAQDILVENSVEV